MKRTTLGSIAVACSIALGAGVGFPSAFAQEEAISPDAPQERALDSNIESVVLYQGRAAITRAASTQLGPGIWKLRFDNLPASIQEDTLEAKSNIGKILSVDFMRRVRPDANASPEAIALDGKVHDKEQEIAALNDKVAGLADELKFIESVAVRSTTDASNQGGTAKLELPALDAQLKWIVAGRTRIQSEMRALKVVLAAESKALAALQSKRQAIGAPSGTAQSAEVLLAVTDGGPAAVRLSYLVSNAQWEPVYSMRADTTEGKMAIELDAMVVQESGEDWKGVRLALSTARPSRAAKPGAIAPAFVDVVMPTPDQGFLPAARMVEAAPRSEAEKLADPLIAGAEVQVDSLQRGRKDRAEFLGREATIGGSGPSVTYTIALPFDAPSDGQIRRRARIASFEAPTKFVYQTQPLVTEGAFLRGTLSNSTQFQMLPGRASVFVGADYVGAMTFAGASPKQKFDVYFGSDPAVTVTRELVKRFDKESGLFGGGLDTISSYKITIANGTGQTIDVELLDRRPVSRNSKIEVAVTSNSTHLSKDPIYLESQFPSGILRWDLQVPPTPTGSEGVAITWTVVVSRSKDIVITPLPAQ